MLKSYLHSYVHCCIIHSNQDLETVCAFTDDWIKEMWHMHTVEYYSALKRKETLPCAIMRMNLEDIMLREINQ